MAGLEEQSRRPHRSPGRKVLEPEEQLILQLRRERKLGLKRLRIELIRSHGLRLSLGTLHKGLVRHGPNRLPHRPKLKRKGTKRYSWPVPGDRVQLDIGKIAPGLYQHAVIDDCCRWQVLGVCPNRNAASTLDFLDKMRAGMPFPVQRIQTDRGGELYAHEVQNRRRDWRIEFRLNRPRAPQLNGKVERVQRTALEEFWSTTGLKAPELPSQLEDWRRFYNQHHPHTSLGGRTPAERLADLAEVIPSAEAVRAACNPAKEIIRSQNSRWRWRASTCARVT